MSEPMDKAIEEAAKAMYDAGAFCGVCAYEDPECPECKQVCLAYARAAYPVFREQMAQRLENRACGSKVKKYYDGWLDAARFLRESDR